MPMAMIAAGHAAEAATQAETGVGDVIGPIVRAAGAPVNPRGARRARVCFLAAAERRPMKPFRFAALAVVAATVALALVASAVGGSAGEAKEPVVVALSTDVDVLDTQLFRNDTGYLVTALLYGSLLQEKYVERNGQVIATGQYVGNIADSYSFSKDRKTVTFKLKRGLKFADGSPLTSADWKYTWDRIFDGPGYVEALLPVIGIANKSYVRAPDPYTLVVKRDFDSPMFLPFMASPSNFNVLSQESANAHKTKADPWAAKWFTANANESGPYMIDRWEKGSQMILKPNPNYAHPERVANGGVVLRVVPSPQDRIALVRGGSIDAAQQIPQRDLKELQGNPNFRIVRNKGTLLSYVGFNLTKPPFDDINLRRAVQKAIDYKTLLQRAIYGFGQPAGSIVSRGMPGYVDVIPPRQDVAAAKAALAKSRYNGEAIPLAVRQSQPQDQAAAVFIQDNLRRVGINVALQTIPDPQMETQLGKKEIPFFITGWQSLGQDGFYQTVWLARSDSPLNYTGFKDPKVDALIKQGVPEGNARKRAQLLRQLQRLWAAQVPMAPLFQPDDVIITGRNVSGVNDFYDPLWRPQFLRKTR
jgi:peptide/nickel transport system substrate-binding protein